MNSFLKKPADGKAARWRFSFLMIALFLGALASALLLQGQTFQQPHGAIKLDCQLCHVTANWTKMRPDMQFNHATTDFPLEGQHAAVTCRSCHRSLDFSQADTHCFDCHQDVHENQFGDVCGRCHNPETWQDEAHFRQMHQETRFPLMGVHGALDCERCHAGGRYTDVPLDCYGCHLETYAATTNPDHQGAGFPLTCGDCHSVLVSSWAGNLAAFQHTASFPLVGGHALEDCRACHQPGTIYSQTSSTCYTCHQSDYETANDPNHLTGNFGTDCAVCHSVMGWSPAQFDHNLTDFPLTGAHQTLACNDCHAQGYTGTSKECMTCHQGDFESATQPIHTLPSFETDCTVCHTTAAWSPSTFDHNQQTSYPLTGSHVSADCAACHVNGVYAGTSALCYTCHQQDFEGAQDPNHVALNYPTECDLCHTTSTWDDASFDHNQTNFPLTGAHVSLNCEDCHSAGYSGTPTDCYACHQDNYTGANNPLHTPPSFDFICTVCHTTAAWSPSTFDHNQQTSYPLTGAHVSANCAACHVNGIYTGTSALCYTCHQQDFEGAQDPNHIALNYPTECDLCHTTSTWDDANFDHNQTNFPLTGAHATLSCEDCHSAGYSGTPTDCYACHQENYAGATPVHTPPSFDFICTVCHTTAAWSPSTFDHNQQTSYQLTGAHVSADCAACHVNGVYAGTSALCYTCHQQDYEQAEDPDHVALNYPHECEICHNTTSWDDANFDHNSTSFPLTGAHTSLSCEACHSQGYSGTPTECYACHQENYAGATPVHTPPSFDFICTVCHTTAAWSPSTFDHNQQTSYQLTGSHVSADCASCHVNGVYAGTSALCYTCHQDDYESVEDPNHVALNYPTECEICHNTTDWGEVGFDHNQTGFPLTGAHTSLSCEACHSAGYSGTPTDCYACHQENYAGATPVHTPPSFDFICTVCHTTAAWSPSTFDHNQQTSYPLTGAHVSASCASCHPGGIYSGTPTDCYSCHQENYGGATNPIHTSPSFSFICTVCHTTAAWSPSTFDHNQQTSYQLTGAHVSTPCVFCHPEGQYAGTPTTCYFCHESDYQRTTNPDHEAAGFPTDCELCHTTITWMGATFDHDNLYFPIYSGSHQGAWNSCTDCHIGGNYNDFSCIDCHEHNQPDMNEDHQGVPGYVYESRACFFCHPNGDAGLGKRQEHPEVPEEWKQ